MAAGAVFGARTATTNNRKARPHRQLQSSFHAPQPWAPYPGKKGPLPRIQSLSCKTGARRHAFLRSRAVNLWAECPPPGISIVGTTVLEVTRPPCYLSSARMP